MNQLDLRDLHYFETIAETGHLGRAAKKVFRSQPALTACIRRLEATLGTPLFEREGRGIRLTAAGDALLRRARGLRIAAEDAAREISDVGSGVAGVVRIGILPTLATFLFPAVSRVFLRTASKLRIKSLVAQNDVLGAQLRAGELDLIVSTNMEVDDTLVWHPVCEDDAVVIASSAHPVLQRKARMRDLLDYRWVLAPPNVGTRRWLDEVFRRHDLPSPEVQIETNLILMMPALIERTELLTFTSRRHVGRKSAGPLLREVAIKELTMHRRFDVFYRKDSYLSPAARRLVELLCSDGAKLFARG